MSDKLLDLSDRDFEAQMQGLVHLAEKQMEGRGSAGGSESSEERRNGQAPRTVNGGAASDASKSSLSEALRPLVAGIQALGRTTGDHSAVLSRIEKVIADAAGSQNQLPQLIENLSGLLDRKETVTKDMFNALHEELRSYKDGFLLDSLHKPLIRDLISLYDHMVQIRAEFQQALAFWGGGESQPEAAARFAAVDTHFSHNLEFVLEVLARLEVTMQPSMEGKLDKAAQRAVTIEPAGSPEEDLDVIRVYKRGFLWKDRVFRPEEVSIKRWKDAPAGTSSHME